MRTKRKLYAKEFKDQAISLVREANRSASSVAKELDINVNTMYNWLGSSSNTGANQSSGKEYAGSSAFLMGKFMRSSRNPLNPSKVFEKATHC